jgi:hypothetical protein
VKAIKVIGILLLGILIGAFGPRLFSKHVDTSWYNLHTKKNKYFGLSYQESVIFSDLPVPDIRSLTGKAKFMEAIGPGETTQIGYIVVVDMDPLDVAKVPRRYKQEKHEKINGFDVTTLPVASAPARRQGFARSVRRLEPPLTAARAPAQRAISSCLTQLLRSFNHCSNTKFLIVPLWAQ